MKLTVTLQGPPHADLGTRILKIQSMFHASGWTTEPNPHNPEHTPGRHTLVLNRPNPPKPAPLRVQPRK